MNPARAVRQACLTRRILRNEALGNIGLVCLLGILLFIPVCGLNRNRPITQLYHTDWTSKDGAPGRIEALAQTSDGYLWLGTSTGLYRFDGVLFERYEPQSGGPFPSNNIFSLLASPDGGLWIGYWVGGVSFLKDGNLINYGEQDGLPTGRLQDIARDDEGTIWAATGEGGLARLEGSRWQRIGMDWNYPGKAAQTVFVDKAGTLWVATENTIVFLPKGTRSFQATGEKTGQVLQIVQAPDGALWMAETSRSVRPMLMPGIDPRSVGPEIRVGSVGILIDREGALWATSIGDGLRRVPFTERFRGQTIAEFSNDAEIFTEKDGLSADFATTILEDREGNIWVGTSNGLDRFRDSNLVPVRFPPGYQNFGLVAGDEGEVWTFSLNRPVTRIRGETPTVLTGVGPPVYCAFRDEDGSIWIGSYHTATSLGDIYRVRKGEVSLFNQVKGFKISNIPVILKDRSGVLWIFVNPEGIFWLKDGIWTRYDRQSELPESKPGIGFIDSANRKWFGYAGNRLTVIDGDRVRTFSRDDGLDVGDVKAIQEYAQHLLVGGEFGLAVFDGSRFRMLSADGPDAFGSISGIVAATGGSLWLNEARGIIQIPANEIRLALDDPAHAMRYRLFDFLDGLPGAPQQNVPYPTAIEGSDGRLWFSTTKGVVWIDPKHVYNNPLPPPVTIRSLNTDRETYDPSPSLQLPAGTTQLRISYTALSLSMPERVSFRYRLEGVDKEWREAGTRREAFYTNLGPGSYRFRVIAANNDGVWNEEGAVFEFKILPMFYQTRWFLLLCFAALGVIAWAAYRLHIRQVRARLQLQFDGRLAERTRIAQDLHDTLLQGVAGASMQLQAAAMQVAETSPAKARLEHISEMMRRVVEEGRDAVEDLRSATEGDYVNPEQRLSQYIQELDTQRQIDFRVTVEGTPRRLRPVIGDETYHICREALINAFNHSGATVIEVLIEYAPRQFRIRVCDNGGGIDPEILRSGRKGHWGLSGMRERAEKIGAHFKVHSHSPSGTEVELSVPNRLAFETNHSNSRFKRIMKPFTRIAKVQEGEKNK